MARKIRIEYAGAAYHVITRAALSTGGRAKSNVLSIWRKKDWLSARDGVNVRRSHFAALDGHPDVRVNQEAHGLRSSWSVARGRLPFLTVASVLASTAPARSPSTPCRSPKTSRALDGGGSGTMQATRRRCRVTTTSSPWVSIVAQALEKFRANLSYVSTFIPTSVARLRVKVKSASAH